ncbi:McrB family protein [Fibrobacter succinogenes]|uniref:AAA domain (Dynein-related subfamily) n=1 Tax=Fibrobacter succinogenes TaxID=833 RepID=A0A380S5H8_FIBSU|nr:AAA family ATPase [Fibrobacter succinogenes]PWJ35827.1 dynein-related subfamily AAA family protein [Fibrobacter succinogenes subsp. elongatus]SUQ24482.1 AAA domain (dynein-related subfamily) [Fibrobacter succinogenes]
MSEKFTWIPFYEEFSQKLLEYKDQVDENGNHATLVEKIKSLNSEWTDFLRAKAVNRNFADVDPFTIFAIFNRSSGMERRCAILKSLKALFGVSAEIPQDFDGIPLANAQKSCFYYEQEKNETIPLLWKLFDAFMNGNTTELAHFFDEAQKKKGIKWNLTMAFFWMKPNEYVPMDTKSRSYLKKHGVDIFSARKLAGERYLQLISDVKNKIDESIPSISRHAFEMNEKLEVNGLMAQDNSEPWQDELIDAMDGDAKPGVFWWHKLPAGQEKTIKLLREKIDNDDPFDFYIFQDRKAVYKAVVADFVCSEEEYAAKKPEWKDCDTQWMKESFSDFQDNNGNRKARILFYIEEFERLEEPIPMDRFVTSKEYKKPHIANLVPFKSIIEEGEKPMDAEDTNNELLDLLNNKKNIILQGAPGTGKTYRTAELALSVIGELPSRNVGEDEKSFHKRVMDAYDAKIIKLNWDGSFANPEAQIGFVTFHQSMDYEDFVEGIKPIKPDEGEMYYKVENGIFKIMSRVATNPQQVKQEKTLNSAFDDLIQNIIDGNVKSLPMKNGGRSSELSVSSQMAIKWKAGNGNIDANCVSKERLLKLCEVYDSKEKIGAITNIDESIRDVIGGCNSSYYWAVANYLLEKIGKVNISNEKTKNYVLIIDEINRGNVSKIFGELISLLEADKRVGGDHPLSVTLPYSKESFSVPSNLYIIGTMNTTDRSVGSIDYAVRRRFAFVTLEADESKVPEGDARNLFNAVKNFLNKSKYDMDIEDLMVGHSYFMTSDADVLKMKWQYEILPLLMEYHKDGIISKSPLKDDSGNEIADVKKDYAKFVEAWQKEESDSLNS